MPTTKGKAAAKIYTISTPVADLLADPTNESAISQRDSQLLFGETFKSSGKKKGWFHGVSVVDDYEGNVNEAHLKPEKTKATHVIDKAISHIYAKPDFKTRPIIALSFMSRLSPDAGPGQNGFSKVPGLGWIYKTHVIKISDLKKNPDPLAAALKFIGTPYLYGGRSAFGLDCSGLVQLSLSYCGVACPRDSVDQIKIGTPVLIENIQRGDLVFFKGHVGFMIDRNHVLNATARSMDTRIDKLEDLADYYKGIIAVRRVRP